MVALLTDDLCGVARMVAVISCDDSLRKTDVFHDCNLDMRRAVITDQDGSAAALRGCRKDYRAFPFHAIWKRIRDREQGFFKPI
jgi:hypothetical protein